jgi:hypothetical protein
MGGSDGAEEASRRAALDPLLEELAAEAAEEWKEANGGGEVTEEVKEAAKRRALALVREERENNGAGHAHALAVSIGAAVPRRLFGAAIGGAAAGEEQKKGWRRVLEKALGDGGKDQGCISVDFYDTRSRRRETAYLLLEDVGAGHDLGAELDKLYGRTAAEAREKLTKELSVLVFLGRSAYGQVLMFLDRRSSEAASVLEEVAGRQAAPVDFKELTIDPANTTFYLAAYPEARVGIRVKIGGAGSPAN